MGSKDQELLTISEVMERLKCTRKVVTRLCRRGLLVRIKEAGKHPKITVESVETYLRSKEIKPNSAMLLAKIEALELRVSELEEKVALANGDVVYRPETRTERSNLIEEIRKRHPEVLKPAT